MDQLPANFAATREALRALACFVVAPARKAQGGRIGLRPTIDGFGTPVLDDGTQIAVRGDRLIREPDGGDVPITTLRAAAAFVGVDLVADPGVGHDLPPFVPDVDLAVDATASLVLGAWYRFGHEVLDALRDELPAGSTSEAQLWPEHFDRATRSTWGGRPATSSTLRRTFTSVHTTPRISSATCGTRRSAPTSAMPLFPLRRIPAPAPCHSSGKR